MTSTSKLTAALAFLLLAAAARPDRSRSFGPGARLVLTDENLGSLFDAAGDAWRPAVAPRTRGGAEIFAKVAPATVVVRTASGHGTGFLISDDGFVLTNYHVVADSLFFDPTRRVSFAEIHLGKLGADGAMVLAPEPVEGLFYAADRRRDLALLKIAAPRGRTALPYVALAAEPPRPGASCAMVGHPRAGMLWSFRSCQIAAIGRFPADMVDVVVGRLSADGAAPREIEASLGAVSGHRIVVSTCEANPGDSGAPIVDESGKLVGVTFAVPERPELAKLAYHIHLDEVRAFLATRPAAPSVMTPDPWALGPRQELVDLAGEGRPQLLEAGGERPEQYLFDLDGDTDPALLRGNDLRALAGDHKFEAELALHVSKQRTTAFYDTDNDGTFDLIVSGRGEPRGAADVVLARTRDGRWQARPARTGELVLAPERFADPALGRRLVFLVDKLGIR